MKIEIQNKEQQPPATFKVGDLVRRKGSPDIYYLRATDGKDFMFISISANGGGLNVSHYSAAFSPVFYELFEGTITLSNDKE